MSFIDPVLLDAAVAEAHRRCLPLRGGAVAEYIPQLAKVDPELYAVAACDLGGRVTAAGDAEAPFTLQSVSKPFVYAQALEELGPDAVHATVGVEPTGYAFYSMIRLQEGTNKPHNPMINAGAIAVTDLLYNADPETATNRVLDFIGRFAGKDGMAVDEAVLASERETGDRNRAIAYLMRHFGMIRGPVPASLDLYFQHCSILATCCDLAVMAATLANGGRYPGTDRQVLAGPYVKYVLTVMFTNGLYDHSGRFAFEVGLPAKSGVSGAILAVAPGRLGVAAFSPRLAEGGNSLRALATLRHLSDSLGLHTFGLGGRQEPAGGP